MYFERIDKGCVRVRVSNTIKSYSIYYQILFNRQLNLYLFAIDGRFKALNKDYVKDYS